MTPFWSRLFSGGGPELPQESTLARHGLDLICRIEADPNVPGLIRIAVRAANKDDRLRLRTQLITAGEIVLTDGTEWNVIDRVPSTTTARELRRAVEEATAVLDHKLQPSTPAPPAISTIWWNKRANFGDVIGPVLVRTITGREVVHADHAQTGLPPLYTVGSVLTFSRIPGATVWGSGLIQPISDEKQAKMRSWAPPTIHAVRGPRTRAELIGRLGWEVPEVYGDPALLAPRLLPPQRPASGLGPILIAHGVHEAYFADRPDLQDVLTLVSPSQGPQEVIRQIVGASACVASSLHGVLTAHAFGVPWTWLRVTDKPLLGDEFKFEDFFASLDRDQVSRIDVARADLTPDVLRRAVREARLPGDHHDLDRLLESFPELP